MCQHQVIEENWRVASGISYKGLYDLCVFVSTGEQGAGAGKSAGSSSLVQSAGSCGRGGEDHPGLAGSDRRPSTHQLHQLGRSDANSLILQCCYYSVREH